MQNKQSINIDLSALVELNVTPEEIIKRLNEQGVFYYKPMNELTGDSDEYWFLAEAVELSKDTEGMCLELGLRLGLGTKTIIDAVRTHCPNKLVVSVDPYGNIPYTGREPDGETHYDYTDEMRNECMANMWAYIKENPVDYRFFQFKDYEYFDLMQEGVPRYEYNGAFREQFYSMVHLDAQHTVSDIIKQVDWFTERMDIRSTLVIDDITPDFVDFRPIHDHLDYLGFKHIKSGGKKAIYQYGVL